MKDVLYILGIKCNLLIIGKFLERKYKIHMENKVFKVMDANVSLILKAPMAKSRTFKVELKLMEHKCIETTTSREELIWHYRLGYLNFKDLNVIQIYNMVTGLPMIDMQTEEYEECVQAKQH